MAFGSFWFIRTLILVAWLIDWLIHSFTSIILWISFLFNHRTTILSFFSTWFPKNYHNDVRLTIAIAIHNIENIKAFYLPSKYLRRVNMICVKYHSAVLLVEIWETTKMGGGHTYTFDLRGVKKKEKRKSMLYYHRLFW